MSESILHRPPDPDRDAPRSVLVAGAGGGIGRSFCRALVDRFPRVQLVRLARRPGDLPALASSCIDLQCDIGDEGSISSMEAALPAGREFDWVFVATRWLHDREHRPEKTYRSLNAAHLVHAYRINAVGPALLVKHLVAHLNRTRASRIGILSARVGSISDNRLGGWYAYRASKAALNMMIKNYAIELSRKKPGHIIVGLQPGTTDTPLSAPFQRGLPDGQLQSPDFTAQHLLEVMRRLRAEDSGGLLDFEGIPFTP